MGYLADMLIRLGVKDDLSGGLDKATRDVKRFGSEMESAGTRLTVGMSVPLLGIGAAALKAAGQMEQTQVAFTTLLKSSDAARTHIEQLKQFAFITPFQFEDVTKMSRLMQAMGTSASDVVPHLRVMGDAVSALGGGSDVLERVVRSMSEIGTRGKISGEQLRELSRAGIPAIEALSKKMGITAAEAQKRVTDGMVDAKTATEALFSYMESRFAGGMEAQSKTLLGSWSNIKDKVVFSLAAIGQALLPMARNFITDTLDPMLSKINQWAEAFGRIPGPIQNIVLGLGGLAITAPIAVLGMGMLITNGVIVAGALSKVAAVVSSLSLGLGIQLATALNTARVGMTAFSAGLAGVVTGGVVLLALEIYKLVKAYKELADVQDDTRGQEKENEAALSKLAEKVKARGVDISAAKKEFDLDLRSTAGAPDEAARLEQVSEATNKYRQALMELSKGHTVSKKEIVDWKDALTDAQKVLGMHVVDLKGLQSALALVKSLYASGAVGLVQYADALIAYNEAIRGSNTLLQEWNALRKSGMSTAQMTGALGAYGRLQNPPTPALMPSKVDVFNLPVAKAALDLYQDMRETILDAAAAQDVLSGNLEIDAEDAKRFGVTTIDTYKRIAAEAEAAYGRMAATGTFSDDALTKADLEMRIDILNASRAMGEIEEDEYRAHMNNLKGIIDELAGKEQDAIKKQVRDRYDLGKEMEAMGHRTFDQLERGLAKNIVEWKGWKDTVKGIGKTFAEDMLSIMLKGLLEPLEKQFAKLAVKIGTWLGGVLSGGGSAAASKASSVGGAAAGAAKGVGSVASGGLMSTVGAVSAAVGAVSSIIGNFQMAGMNKSLDIIVKHTLQTANDLANLRVDAWAREAHLMVKLDDMWNAIRDTTSAVMKGGVGGGKGGVIVNFYAPVNGSAAEIANAIFNQAKLAGAI